MYIYISIYIYIYEDLEFQPRSWRARNQPSPKRPRGTVASAALHHTCEGPNGGTHRQASNQLNMITMISLYINLWDQGQFGLRDHVGSSPPP